MIKLENYSRDIIVLCVQKTSIQLSMSKDLVLDELQNIYPNIISSVIKMEPMLFKFPIKTALLLGLKFNAYPNMQFTHRALV